MNLRHAFTLVELVIIIVVLSILAMIALPKFVGMEVEARKKSAEAILSAVKSGISLYIAESVVIGRTPKWPSELDNAASGTHASAENPFFGNVLHDGITDSRWVKTISDTVHSYSYEYDFHTNLVFVYDTATGETHPPPVGGGELP